MKEALGSCKYLVDEIGATQLIRWRAEPFSIVSCGNAPDAANGNNGVRFIPRGSIGELRAEKGVALDLEVKDWKGKKEPRAGTIYMASFVTNSDFGNYVLSTYETESDVLSAEGNIAAKIILCRNEQELTAKLTELFRSFDPLWVFGSNVGTYDLLKLRDTGGFNPGVLGRAPVLEANCGFFKRVGIEGCCVVDTASWSANWGWTPNNKLVTVGSYLLGREVKKDLTYDQMDEMLGEADPADISKIALYNLKDSVFAYDVGRFILDHVILSSMFYGTSPSTICTTGRKSIVMDLDNKRQMTQMKTVEKGGIDREFSEFSIDSGKYQLLKSIDPECVGAKRGLFRGVHVIYPTPFIHALGRYAAFNWAGTEMYKLFMDETTDPKTRIFFAETLNVYLEKMVYDLCRMRRIALADLRPIHSPFDVTDAEMPSDVYYGVKYCVNSQGHHHTGGYRPNNFMTVTNLICDSIGQTLQALRNAEVINYSDRFLFAKFNNDESLRALVGSGLGVHLGKADVLSSTQGRVLYRVEGGAILSEERDPTGRKGHRVLLEQEMTAEFGKLVFQDRSKAISYVWETMKGLVEGKLPRKKLIFETTARIDNESLSAPAFMQERSQMMMKYGIKKEETLSYGYGRLVNGLPGKDERGRTYPEGYIGDIPASLFLFEPFFDEVLVATSVYIDRMFGEKTSKGRDLSNGTIGDLLVSAFPSRTAKVRDVLNAVAEGDPNAQIDSIIQEQQMLF